MIPSQNFEILDINPNGPRIRLGTSHSSTKSVSSPSYGVFQRLHSPANYLNTYNRGSKSPTFDFVTNPRVPTRADSKTPQLLLSPKSTTTSDTMKSSLVHQPKANDQKPTAKTSIFHKKSLSQTSSSHHFRFLSSNQIDESSLRHVEQKEPITSYKNLFSKMSKFSLPELVTPGTRMTSPVTSKLASPRSNATKSDFYKESEKIIGPMTTRNGGFGLDSRRSSAGKQEMKTFRSGSMGETAYGLNSRPITGFGVPPKKKSHGPARFIEIKKSAGHLYAAEYFNVYEKTGGLINTPDHPFNSELQGENIIESYRKRLNANFMNKFSNGNEKPTELDDEIQCYEEAEDRMDEKGFKSTQHMVPSLTDTNSEPSSPTELSKSRGGSLKSRQTLRSLTKLDTIIKKADHKRPAVVGLPEEAKIMKPTFVQLMPKGGVQRLQNLRRRTTKMMHTKFNIDDEIAKHEAEEKRKKEEQLLDELMNRQLDVVVPPTKLLAHQHLNEVTLKVLLKNNDRLIKQTNHATTFKRIRKRLLEVLTELKKLKLNPKQVPLLRYFEES